MATIYYIVALVPLNLDISKFNEELELEANAFAFFALTIHESTENINIIDLAIHKGVPEQIAIQVYDLTQSVLQL